MGNLTDHAKYELELAGLFDKDSDYDGMLGTAVMELVEKFSEQGHSGASASIVLSLFKEVVMFKNLTPITSNPDEWLDQSEMSEEPIWQNKRRSSSFSRDGGKTWYDIDDRKYNNGDTWKKKPNGAEKSPETPKPTKKAKKTKDAS